MLWVLFVILTISLITFAEEVLVSLPNGKLNGAWRDHYLAFEGIPYAKPPIGELRFEPPQPYVDQWEGVRDARKPGAVCMQWDHLVDGVNKLTGEEDCLFVNVYTPSLNASALYPVVVYIHGGAFMFGSGDFWNPENFLRRSFIVVTVNYRLGPLGFLSTENSVIPGNMGLKDQVMALQWVKENIAFFNGDPAMVTLSGFSAGGASVHLHLMSDMSKGLFHCAIAHSGTALNPWVQGERMLKKTKTIAISVGCTASSDEQEIIRCLKQKPAGEIVQTVARFLTLMYSPFSPFGVVVEENHAGAFLVDKPINLLKQKRVHDIPFIASAVEMEGLYPAAEFYNELSISEIDSNWNEYLPAILEYQHTAPNGDLNPVSTRIRSHYLGTEPLTKKTFHRFSKAVTDRLYLSDIGEAVRLHPFPVFFYFFTYKASTGVGEVMSHQNECLGVAHGEDMLLLYKTKLRDTPYTEDEELMIESLLDMYETFSATGSPFFGDVKLAQTTMDSSGAFSFNNIQGPKSVIVEKSANFGEVKFWSKLGLHEN